MNDLLTGAEPPAPHAARPAAGLKIVSLVAENVKRIQAIEIRPNGDLVEITGRNAQGKTSVLDSIWWLIKGRGAVQSTPIRKGQERALIRADLGEYTVTRTFNAVKDGPGYTTSVKVENANGFRASSPQALLDSLMGDLSIDPLAFMRIDGRRQLDLLRGFVVGFDFEANATARQAAFDKRTEVNRDAKRARAAAYEIVVPSELPAEMIDEAALTVALANAGEHNAAIETRRQRREEAAGKVAQMRADADAAEAGLPAVLARIEADRDEAVADLAAQIDDLRSQIARLETRIAERRNSAAERIEAERAGIAQDAVGARAEADRLEQQLTEAPALPDPIDVADLQRQMSDARNVNGGIRQRTARDRQVEAAEALEGEAETLTAAIEAADVAKVEAIAGAKLPVPGIEFGDGMLLLNGVPLDQASGAELLRVSVAIAIAQHPKLRVIRVKDGNALDPDGMKLMVELAAEHNCQIWIETVRSDDRVAVVIEDGRVRGHEPAEAA